MRNKLFTASVDKMLFKQYPLGDDLEKQKVVAKIFNPYGDARWYLLNSDPEDPDYIWAIVSMQGNVEIGSVSRSELLGARIRPFGLPLERDLYFTPQNAAEVYRGLLDGKFYNDGGEVEEMKQLWFVTDSRGAVKNISTSVSAAEVFLASALKYDGVINYVKVPLKDWESEKVSVGNIRGYASSFWKNYKKGGKIPMIKEADIQVGKVFKLINGEVIEIKRLFAEPRNMDEPWAEYTFRGETSENSVNYLKNFINHWRPMQNGFAKGGISDSDREKSIAELKRKIKHFREVEKSEPMARYYEEALFYMTEGKENAILKRGKYAKGGHIANGGEISYDKLTIALKSKLVQAYGLDRATSYLDQNQPVSPFDLVRKAVYRGFMSIDDVDGRTFNIAEEVVMEYADMEEIGSSDYTFILKSFLEGCGLKADFKDNKLVVVGKYAKGGYMAKGGKVSEKIKVVAFPTHTDFKYYVIEETPNEYVVVSEEKIDHWKQSDTQTRYEFYEEVLPKDMVIVLGYENNVFAKGGYLSQLKEKVNLTNELRGEGDNDDYGTFEIYKKGGEVEVQIVNKEDDSQEKYGWLLDDYDRDGLKNADDKNPYNEEITEPIDQPSLSGGIDYLLELKHSMDDIMLSFVDELKEVAPDKSKIYARTKTPYSILNKLIKKRLLNPKTGLTDLIGTTIVVDNKKQLEGVKAKLASGKLGKVIEMEDMYAHPKQGYRAYHFLIEKNGLPLEVQLKTKRQKAVNKLSHEPYKLGKLDAAKLIKATELADRADNGDKEAIKEYNQFMSQPDLDHVFYTGHHAGKFAKGGEIKHKQEFAYGGVVPENSFVETEIGKVFSYYFVNKGVLWNVLVVWGKYNYVSVTKKSNNPFGGVLGKDFDNVSAAVDYYKDANIKSNIIFAADEAKKYGYEFAFAKGGRVGYERLVKKVAANYKGKAVPSKYQPKYGKRYDADEAKQVGYAVATKVYGKPMARMAEGGVVSKYNEFGLYTDEYIKQISKEASEKISDGYLARKYGEDIGKLKPWHIESLRQIFYKDCIQKSKEREEQINMENVERSERGVQAMLDWLDEDRGDRTDEQIKKEFMFNANKYAKRPPLLYPEYAEGGETDSEITAEDRMVAQQHNYKLDL